MSASLQQRSTPRTPSKGRARELSVYEIDCERRIRREKHSQDVTLARFANLHEKRPFSTPELTHDDGRNAKRRRFTVTSHQGAVLLPFLEERSDYSSKNTRGYEPRRTIKSTAVVSPTGSDYTFDTESRWNQPSLSLKPRNLRMDLSEASDLDSSMDRCLVSDVLPYFPF